MLEVLKLFIEARDAPLKQVKFEGTLGPSFVETTPEEINRAVDAVPRHRGQPRRPRVDAPRPRTRRASAPRTRRPTDSDVGSDDEQPPRRRRRTRVEATEAVERRRDHLRQGAREGRSAPARPKLPVYYPTKLESGSDYAQKPRVYKINGTGGGAPPNSERAAYKWVFSRPTLGEYYGFMATRWKDPPILEEPVRREGDRRPDLQALLRRRPPADDRLAGRRGLVLGLQHPRASRSRTARCSRSPRA